MISSIKKFKQEKPWVSIDLLDKLIHMLRKNPRYRSRDDVCKDVAHILSLELKWGTKYAVLKDALWTWSEFNGKYDGCRYWSCAAWRVKNEMKKLMHEHVVPKSVIIAKMKELKKPTAGAVKRILSKYCIGVVITRKEDKKLNECGLRANMPKDWNRKDVWARYRTAGIKWVKIHSHYARQEGR